MMSSVNKVILVGHLGKDPDIRRNTNGDPIVSFSVATSERWTDKASGDKRERTEWHRVVIFNEGLAKLAEQYLKKGSKVYLEGQLQTRKYEQNGVEKYTTEIVLQRYRGEIVLLDKSESNRPPPAASSDDYGTMRRRGEDPQADSRQSSARTNTADGARFDDDIPF